MRIRSAPVVAVLALACTAPHPQQRTLQERPAGQLAVPLERTGCWRPNVEDADGTPACVHLSASDMPLRIAVGTPRVPARYGSRKATRAVAIEAMRMWEEALQPELPWFRLEFVEEDAAAPVQVEWRRRMTGRAAGRGWLEWRVSEGRLHVGGSMQVTTQPYLPIETPLELPEIKMLVAHEFGHVLGLGHSLDRDSAMNYSWHTRDRIFVTRHDVETFLALVSQPSGLRVDGEPLAGLRADDSTGVLPASRPALEMVRAKRGRQAHRDRRSRDRSR